MNEKLPRYRRCEKWLRALILSSSMLFTNAPMSAYVEPWPTVAPVKKIVDFPDATHAELSLDLRGNGDQSLYRLECHTWSYDNRDFDYSGDFECRLIPLYAATEYSTLLTDDPGATADWESRARFLESPSGMGETPRLQAAPSGGSRAARGRRTSWSKPIRARVACCSNRVGAFGFSRLQSTHKPSPSGEGI